MMILLRVLIIAAGIGLIGCDKLGIEEAPVRAQACIDQAYADYKTCSSMVNQQISLCYEYTVEFINLCDDQLILKLTNCKELK